MQTTLRIGNLPSFISVKEWNLHSKESQCLSFANQCVLRSRSGICQLLLSHPCYPTSAIHRTELIREPVSVITLFIVVDFISISLAEIALNSSIPSRYSLPHPQRLATEERKYRMSMQLYAIPFHSERSRPYIQSVVCTQFHLDLIWDSDPASRIPTKVFTCARKASRFTVDHRDYSLKASLWLIIRVNGAVCLAFENV